MEKLFKTQYLTVALVMAVCLALMTLVLPRIPDKVYSLPLWALILGEYVFTFVVLTFAQLQSLRQSIFNFKLAPGLVSLGLVFLILSLGVIVSPVSALGPNGVISIGVVQIMIINLAILFSIFILKNLENATVERAITDEESSNATDTNIKRLTRIRMKAVQDQEEDIEESSDPELGGAPNFASQSTSAQLAGLKQAGQASNLSQGLINRTTHNKVVEGVKPNIRPGTQAGRQSTTRQVVDISTVEKLLVPGSQSNSQKMKTVGKDVPPTIQRLPSANPSKTQNKISDPQKPVSGTLSKLQGLSASGTGSIHSGYSRTDAPDLKSVLDRLDSPDDVGSSSQPATLFKQPVDNEMDNLFAKIAPAAKPEIARATPPVEEQVEEQEVPKLFKEQVDNEVEEIFSSIVPASAQRQVSNISDEKEVAPSLPVDENPVSDTSASSLFKQPIDKEMDSIFAKIAPDAKPEISRAEVLPISGAELSDTSISSLSNESASTELSFDEPAVNNEVASTGLGFDKAVSDISTSAGAGFDEPAGTVNNEVASTGLGFDEAVSDISTSTGLGFDEPVNDVPADAGFTLINQ